MKQTRGPTHPSYSFPAATMPLTEAEEQGRALRATIPRRSIASFVAPDRDPVAILEEQNRNRLPDLVPIRIGRMMQSAFSFYRGSAAVMAHDLAREPRTGVHLVVCGDAHVSNFGLFASPERHILFDVNDFDEVAFGPWEWDVKRLVASAVVGARQLGFDPAQVADAARGAASGYREALNALFAMNALERFYYRVETDWLVAQSGADDQLMIRKAIKKARHRTADRVLANITMTDEHGDPRIVDEAPLIQHSDVTSLDKTSKLYETYRSTVHVDIGILLEQFRVVDSVLRIVGVGSVGTRCSIALLIGLSREPLFIQIKEAGPSVLDTYGGLRPGTARDGTGDGIEQEGWRVVAGQRILQAASDPFLGWVRFNGRDFYCRQFRDMKGSVELEALTATQFAEYARLCGAVLARAHAQSPDAGMVAGYVGTGPHFDDAVTAWAQQYADQVERDYEALGRAVRDGRLPCEEGV